MEGAAPDAAEKNDENFRVAVRVRPLNARETSSSAKNAWKVKKNMISTSESRDVSLHFDNLFGVKSTTSEVYEAMAKDVVVSAMEGIHGTVFAYGQTSSGKTHTMMGSNQSPGVIPLAVQDIFSYARKTYDREFLIRVSYLEIYQECIRDLFKPEDDDLKLHEHPEQGFYVKATEVMVASEEEIMQLMDSGEAHRHVGQTNMNEKSSRSHTLFRITIESKVEIADDGEVDSDDDEDDHKAGLCIRAATLNLVDLAGSERVGDTGAEGVRLKEAGQINKSLLTLGNVIKKLSDGASGHIPYRDSELTKLLQPSLGGNGKTSMICAVTPSSTHVDETRSTLMFADRAKNVKNSARVNEVMDDKALLLQSKKEVAALQQQLLELKNGGGVSAEDMNSLVQQKHKVEADNEALQKKIAQDATKLSHMSAMLIGVPALGVGGRRASQPVAASSRRVTFGNYSHRADTRRRISVLQPPSLGCLESSPDGEFGKIKSFQDFKPMAAWDDDDTDRDLGVLQEFEEQEEEEEEDTMYSEESTRYDDRSDRIQELEIQLSESERKVADLEQAAETANSSTQDCAKLEKQITELQQENEGQAREIAHIEEEYSRVMEEATAVREQLVSAEEAAEKGRTTDQQLQEVQATLAEYKVKLMSAEASAESKELQDVQQASSEQIDKLERDRYALKVAAKEKDAKITTMQDEASKMQQQLETANQALDALRTEAGQQEKKFAAANSQIQQLQESLGETKKQDAATKRELREKEKELKQAVAQNNTSSAGRDASKMAKQEARLKEVLKEKASLNSEKLAAQREARDLQKSVNKLKATLDRKDTTSGVKTLRTQVESLEADLKEAHRVRDGLRTQKDEAELQCAEMMKLMQEEASKMESLQGDVTTLQAEKGAAETRAAASLSELESKSTEVGELQKQCSCWEAQVAELRSGAQQATDKNNELAQQVVALEHQLEEREVNLTAAQATAAAAEHATEELAALRPQCVQLEKSLAELTTTHQCALEEKERTNSRVLQLAADLSEAQKQVEAGQASVSTYTSQQDALKHSKAELQTALEAEKEAHARSKAELQTRLEGLEGSNQVALAGAQKTSYEVEQLTAERDDLAIRNSELEAVAGDAVTAVESQQEELDALRAQANSNSGVGPEVGKLQAKLVAEEESKGALKMQVRELTEEVEMLEDDKIRLRDLVAVKERMVADERKQRETLEGKMRRIKGKVKGTTSSLSSSKENRC